MNKRILVIGLALALGGVSAASLAAEPGNFYVGAGVGQAKWHLGGDTRGVKFDDTHTTANVRFGYVWHWGVDFAVEGGYVDLGKLKTSWADYADDLGASRTQVKDQGLFAGVKVKKNFAGRWYVDARGGLYEGKVKQNGTDYSKNAAGQVVADDTFTDSETKAGYYAGVGVGYDLSRHFSLGLAYNYYHSDFFDSHVNVGTAVVSAEYRF